MTTVALVVHPDHPEARNVADRAEQWLTGHGHGVIRIDAAAGADEARAPLGEGVDLAVSLGGDGTMLRTVALACPGGVPVLSSNTFVICCPKGVVVTAADANDKRRKPWAGLRLRNHWQRKSNGRSTWRCAR